MFGRNCYLVQNKTVTFNVPRELSMRDLASRASSKLRSWTFSIVEPTTRLWRSYCRVVPGCGAKCARACRFLLWSERARFLILPKTYGVATSVILRTPRGAATARRSKSSIPKYAFAQKPSQ